MVIKRILSEDNIEIIDDIGDFDTSYDKSQKDRMIDRCNIVIVRTKYIYCDIYNSLKKKVAPK